MNGAELRRVALRQYPTRLGLEARQHTDELLREFTLMASGHSTGTTHEDVPRRLVRLIDTLRQQYGAGSAERDAQLFASAEAGIEEIDVELELPRAATTAVQTLGDLLDEADEYCRQGRHLLTLATPPDVVRFRRWYLDQVRAQLDGAEPTPWPQYNGG